MSTPPILIIGSGPAGLTSALTLRQNGIPVRVIERRDSFHGGIRGTALQPRTQEVLEFLDALEEVQAISTSPFLVAIHGSGHEIISEFRWSEPADSSPSIPYPDVISVNQSVFEQVLRDKLKEFGVTIELGVELTGIKRNDDEGVTVRLRSGEKETTESFPYAIAADGARGRTYSMLGLKFLGETKESDFMFTANIECTDIDRTHWHRWGGFEGKAFLLKPVHPTPLFQLQALGAKLPNPFPEDLEGIQEVFNDISKSSDIVLRNPTWFSIWRANIRMANKFTSGRVFLVGDAGHCHSPAGGQGSNTGIMDGFNIGWKLALVYKSLAKPSLLETYDIERMPVVAETLNLSTELHLKAWKQAGHITSALDPHSHGNAEKDPRFRSRRLLQLGVNYRWSNIVSHKRPLKVDESVKRAYDVGANGIRAGDRAPDAPFLVDAKDKGQGPKRLFELMKGGNLHTILVFTGRSGVVGDLPKYPGVARIVAVLPANSYAAPSLVNADDAKIVVDSQGHAYAGYQVAEKRVYVVVRPDGFIGAYAIDVEELRAFFGLFLDPPC